MVEESGGHPWGRESTVGRRARQVKGDTWAVKSYVVVPYVGNRIFRTQLRAVYSLAMKLAGDFLVNSTSNLSALFDRTLVDVRLRLSRFLIKPRSVGQCRFGRVSRYGWMDHTLSWLGWYPWQCIQCRTCRYFRRRY
jgi:hypothetical protein